LPGIINSDRISAPDSIFFDCAALAVLLLGHRIKLLFLATGLTMFFEVVAAFFLILSVGILVAHALDAYRS
jgi:hypothetical protein